MQQNVNADTVSIHLLCCRMMFCSGGSSGRHAVTVAAITRRYHVASESVTDTLLTACEELHNAQHTNTNITHNKMDFENIFKKSARKNLSTLDI